MTDNPINVQLVQEAYDLHKAAYERDRAAGRLDKAQSWWLRMQAIEERAALYDVPLIKADEDEDDEEDDDEDEVDPAEQEYLDELKEGGHSDDDEDELEKAASHKFLAKIPIAGKTTKTGKQRFRYVYKLTSKRGSRQTKVGISALHMHEYDGDPDMVGAMFKDAHTGHKGHWVIIKHGRMRNGRGYGYALQHDTTGAIVQIRASKLQEFVHGHFKEEIDKEQKRRRRFFDEQTKIAARVASDEFKAFSRNPGNFALFKVHRQLNRVKKLLAKAHYYSGERSYAESLCNAFGVSSKLPGSFKEVNEELEELFDNLKDDLCLAENPIAEIQNNWADLIDYRKIKLAARAMLLLAHIGHDPDKRAFSDDLTVSDDLKALATDFDGQRVVKLNLTRIAEQLLHPHFSRVELAEELLASSAGRRLDIDDDKRKDLSHVLEKLFEHKVIMHTDSNYVEMYRKAVSGSHVGFDELNKIRRIAEILSTEWERTGIGRNPKLQELVKKNLINTAPMIAAHARRIRPSDAEKARELITLNSSTLHRELGCEPGPELYNRKFKGKLPLKRQKEILSDGRMFSKQIMDALAKKTGTSTVLTKGMVHIYLKDDDNGVRTDIKAPYPVHLKAMQGEAKANAQKHIDTHQKRYKNVKDTIDRVAKALTVDAEVKPIKPKVQSTALFMSLLRGGRGLSPDAQAAAERAEKAAGGNNPQAYVDGYKAWYENEYKPFIDDDRRFVEARIRAAEYLASDHPDAVLKRQMVATVSDIHGSDLSGVLGSYVEEVTDIVRTQTPVSFARSFASDYIDSSTHEKAVRATQRMAFGHFMERARQEFGFESDVDAGAALISSFNDRFIGSRGRMGSRFPGFSRESAQARQRILKTDDAVFGYDMDEDIAGMKDILANISKDVYAPVKIHVSNSVNKLRAYCWSVKDGSKPADIWIDRDDRLDTTLAHEYAHQVEHQTPAIREAANTLRDERGKESRQRKLKNVTGNSAYREHEVTYEDEWKHPYMGKWYGHQNSTEVLTMGIERLLTDAHKFRREDEEHFHFTVAALSGQFKDEVVKE